MSRTRAPFRADVVGSILRTAPLKEARAKRDKGEITAAQLTAVEDREIEKIIKKQEEVGLKCATDGEFRRSWWHFDFYGMLDGVEIVELDHGIQFQGVQTRPRTPRITGKLGFSSHPMLEHFKFLKAHTSVTPKMCIPSPATLHFRLEPNAVDPKFYADRSAIFDDLANTYRQAIRGFYDAGCRYLQFDDTAWAYLCSQAELKKARERGLDAERLQQDYARVINKALEGKPADMVVTTHVCRGNFRSTWISEGGYEPVAEIMLGQLNYDGYFLEYDTFARRRLRAAALFAQRQQDRGARPHHHQVRHAREEGRRQAQDRRGDQIRKPRSARAVAAMRLRLDRGRQCARGGGAMGEAQDGGRTGE